MTTSNPFASSHSLDTNPFDDPSPTFAAESQHIQHLQQRERDLEQRERDLNAKADHLRRHGRNNWPPCWFGPLLLFFIYHLPLSSFSLNLPFNTRWDPGRFSSPHHPLVSTMARPIPHFNHQHGSLHFYPPRRRCRWRSWFRRKHRVSCLFPPFFLSYSLTHFSVTSWSSLSHHSSSGIGTLPLFSFLLGPIPNLTKALYTTVTWRHVPSITPRLPLF